MIRRATMSDLPRVYALVGQLHKATEYAKRDIDVSEPAMHRLFKAALARNGSTGDGGTLLNVFEHKGQIEGFMLGALQRVYHIGNRLEAQDFFLYCTPGAPNPAWSKLVDAFVEWASANPKVADIVLSTNDVAGTDPLKLGRLYARKGFMKRGEIWKRADQ